MGSSSIGWRCCGGDCGTSAGQSRRFILGCICRSRVGDRCDPGSAAIMARLHKGAKVQNQVRLDPDDRAERSTRLVSGRRTALRSFLHRDARVLGAQPVYGPMDRLSRCRSSVRDFHVRERFYHKSHAASALAQLSVRGSAVDAQQPVGLAHRLGAGLRNVAATDRRVRARSRWRCTGRASTRGHDQAGDCAGRRRYRARHGEAAIFGRHLRRGGAQSPAGARGGGRGRLPRLRTGKWSTLGKYGPHPR